MARAHSFLVLLRIEESIGTAVNRSMHVREIVDVASLVALHGPILVESSSAPTVDHLEQYWSMSKCRADNWSRALKGRLERLDADSARDQTLLLRATLDEIFVSEMVTRLWSAVLVACDRRRGVANAEPIARSVLATHLEVRNRALSLLTQGGPLTTTQAASANRLRRRAERWTDVLLGGLWHTAAAHEFAIDAERARDFAEVLAERRQRPGGRQAWRLTLVSLGHAFDQGLAPMAVNPESNARIAASILASFPTDVFDSTGMFRSLWMMRMSANASDAQGLISELLQTCRPPSVPQASFRSKRRI